MHNKVVIVTAYPVTIWTLLCFELHQIQDHFYYKNAPHLYSKSGLGFVLTPSIAKKLLVQNCDFEFSLLSGRAETPCQNAIQKPQKAMKWCCARENDTDRVNWDYELVHMRHFHDFGQSDQFRPYWHNLFCILVTLMKRIRYSGLSEPIA